MNDIKELLPYAETLNQEEKINAVIEYGSHRKAAKALGCSKSAVSDIIKRVKKAAAKKGFCPESDMTHLSAPGFTVKGVSSLYNGDGDLSAQWVKTYADKELQAEQFRDFIEGISEGIKGESKTTEPEGLFYDQDLMSAIIIGDAHIGMLAHQQETLIRDFDSNIAVSEIRIAVDNLIDRSPNAETGLFVNVGDFLHSNSSKNETVAGTQVSCDTRYSRTLMLAGMLTRYSIDKMLKKFRKVIVVCAQGNHDADAAIALSMMIEFYYENNKRVTVQSSVSKFNYIEFGGNLIGVTHGDKIKPEKLVSGMAATHKAWSNSDHRFFLTGHVHHKKTQELDGCTVYSFGTLAPPDRWHASHGFVGSKQTMSMMVFHKKHGLQCTMEYNLPVSNEV